MTVKVKLWGNTVGYLQDSRNGNIIFQYDKAFQQTGIEIAPATMPLSNQIYSFPGLNTETYHGLPGAFADSLPDKFGNLVIKSYLEQKGKSFDDLSTLEKLCFVGQRGMGALEYEPAWNDFNRSEEIDIKELSYIAQKILDSKINEKAEFDDKLISQLLVSGSSAGGARAKTLIAWNQETNEVRSGQVKAGPGFTYWLLKFGNINNNKDKEKESDKPDYAKIEYAYYLMAKDAEINMTECKLLQEDNAFHFLTKRFDRDDSGNKIHMQSLCAAQHMDFNKAGIYDYREIFTCLNKLKLSYSEKIQLFRRIVFNDLTCNYDDHTKNISFLMDKQGQWRLSPAYDVTFACNPAGDWTNQHQICINGKTEKINDNDLLALASDVSIKKTDAKNIIEHIRETVKQWPDYAKEADVPDKTINEINKYIDRGANQPVKSKIPVNKTKYKTAPEREEKTK